MLNEFVTTLLRDARGLHLTIDGDRFEGTWLGPGFDEGVYVEVRRVTSDEVRVLWHGCVGGDDLPGVIWTRVK